MRRRGFIALGLNAAFGRDTPLSPIVVKVNVMYDLFRRLEGIWYSEKRFYFTSTNGGEAGLGQVWIYDPKAETITLMFESPSVHVLDFPDNITVSPSGGLVAL